MNITNKVTWTIGRDRWALLIQDMQTHYLAASGRVPCRDARRKHPTGEAMGLPGAPQAANRSATIFAREKKAHVQERIRRLRA